MACSVDERQAAELVALGQEGSHDEPQRGQAQTAGHQHHVAATGLLHRPASTVGTAHAQDRARPQLADHVA